MTVLTKTARQEILTKVLKEAFEPKFADLQKRLVQYVLEWRRTQHPVFEELLAHKDAAQYLRRSCDEARSELLKRYLLLIEL